MTTTSPEPSPYAVRLDADDKHGILPHAESPDFVPTYEYMRELAAWLLDTQSKASLGLKAKAGVFYTKLEASQNSASDVPSYDEYLDLVDTYNDEQGYESPLRSVESDPNVVVQAQLAEILALLKSNPDTSRRQGLGFRERARLALDKVADTRGLNDAQPTHPAPSSQAPTGNPRRRH